MSNERNTPFNQAGVETNCLYLMSLAMDRILRHNEWLMSKQRERFRHEKKQLFTRYARAVRDACILQDQLTQDIWDVEESHDYRNVDTWLDQANELARLILLFADKSPNQDVCDAIFRFIRSQPGEGIVDEKMLESFYLQKK